MKFSPSRQQLYHLLRHSTEPDLALAALYIAQEEYPTLDISAYLNKLNTMAMAVEEQLAAEAYPLKVLQTINRYLYEDLGFTGNTQCYYDPRNSFLNDVMDRRLGIPITLSLVYMEVARRVGFPMVGINFPGHFLIRPDRGDMSIHVDPFFQGELLFEQDCCDRITQVFGQPMDLRPEFFAVVSPQQFLIRLLTNLKQIYLNENQLEKCLGASEQILLVDPKYYRELRDRGILYYHVGRWSEAQQDLQEYLAQHPSPEHIPLVRKLLNQMNDFS
ncbi:tetratricopeptide repeat protein [Acaryochloris sp. IP29b_bin.137]|uniref:SirB1 family protein n=1 Tax=Acaryochloris sp. IP29b_bin.137 TaxID=2969217 RepID=UPI00261ED2D6|nr:tetratricopeptide repeat protein [Acaryochloris sp. IP29b_bin.137]